MKRIVLIAFMLINTYIFAAIASPMTAVKQALFIAAKNWNQGNLREYTKIYDNSAKTLYITNTIITGYQKINQNLLQRFANRQQMGHLSFDHLQIKTLSADYVLVIGHYQLQRSQKYGGNAGGIAYSGL